MKLWFDNGYNKREIANCNEWPEVVKAIGKFIDDCNAQRPANMPPFESYYMRIHVTDGQTHIDVGSHTQFFIWDGIYKPEKEV